MRYSALARMLKYFRYYWIAANSKGHGIHSPFVFKFIQELLNSKRPMVINEDELTNTLPLIQEIEYAYKYTLPFKIKSLIKRSIQQFRPNSYCVLKNEMLVEGLVKSEKIDFVFMAECNSVDLIFSNLDLLMQKLHADSWMILQGIHTSPEMEKVWQHLKKHPKVRLTIDLFFIGFLFCRTEQREKEHFIIRY